MNTHFYPFSGFNKSNAVLQNRSFNYQKALANVGIVEITTDQLIEGIFKG